MPHINANNPEGIQPTREDFSRLLRTRAEDAAEASLHHASLSQQYLELSKKFSSLAEQAGSISLEDLKHDLARLEQKQDTGGTATTWTAARLSTPGGPNTAAGVYSTDHLHAPVTTASSLAEPDVTKSALPSGNLSFPDSVAENPSGTPKADSDIDVPASKSEHADSASPVESRKTKRNRKRGPQNTRKLVERVRAAKLAARSLVRVKAKKADLKPKQRTAKEELKKSGRSLVSSTLLFAVAVFLLSLIRFQFEVDVPMTPIMAAFASEITEIEDPLPIEPPAEEQGEQTEQMVEEPVEEEPPEEPEPEPEMPAEAAEPEQTTEPVMEETTLPETPTGTEPTSTEPASADAAAMDNHSDAGRQALLQKFGGSQASESAVQKALEWLLSVQHPQGYWDFTLVGQCTNPGTVNNPIGGTAYALLPFLAAGQTHQDGNYQKQVGAGLTFLTKIGVNTPAGYDLRGMINKNSDDKAPNEAYYVHGAATLALCEAYGITKDRRLKSPAEGAIKFIVNSQDPKGGGWRYNPQEPGSTSVTAIQVMALISAKKAGIKVPDKTFQGIMYYLDSVQGDREGRYGYEVEKKSYSGAITAMSLLSRMYLGWGRDDGDLRAGVALLDKAGPYDNLYSLYFATQVMKNWGGKEWERWNVRMRDDLIATQETAGPATGSWKPRTGAIHSKQGGRLLTTALATLTLEVYYRYKPLLPEEQPDDQPTTAIAPPTASEATKAEPANP